MIFCVFREIYRYVLVEIFKSQKINQFLQLISQVERHYVADREDLRSKFKICPYVEQLELNEVDVY